MASEERLRELEEKYEGFTVYDNGGSKIGKVDDLFVDESDNEEYIGVKMGLLGSKTTLIPTEIVRVNEGDRSIEVAESKDRVKDAPSFSDDEDVTAEYEERIRRHFGLESLGSGSSSGSYGGATGGAATGATAGSSDRDDGEYSDRGSSYSPDDESSGGVTREETYGSSSGGATYREGSGESSGSEGYREGSGSPEGTETRYGNTESTGSSGSSESGGSSGSRPTTTRQTEETETFQEGGRTKVRRRIIREEVVDADDQGTHS